MEKNVNDLPSYNPLYHKGPLILSHDYEFYKSRFKGAILGNVKIGGTSVLVMELFLVLSMKIDELQEEIKQLKK